MIAYFEIASTVLTCKMCLMPV